MSSNNGNGSHTPAATQPAPAVATGNETTFGVSIVYPADKKMPDHLALEFTKIPGYQIEALGKIIPRIGRDGFIGYDIRNVNAIGDNFIILRFNDAQVAKNFAARAFGEVLPPGYLHIAKAELESQIKEFARVTGAVPTR